MGYGIPITVNTYLSEKNQPNLGQEKAVEWALKLNKTTRSMPYNARRGLDTISSFVIVNRGSWSLYSDNVKMEGGITGNQFFTNPIQSFTGTVIEIIIKVDSLDKLETVDYLDW